MNKSNNQQGGSGRGGGGRGGASKSANRNGSGRGSKSSNAKATNARSTNAKNGGRKKGKGRGRGGRSKKVDPVKYWGSIDTLPPADEYVTTTPDPGALVNSLGRPPIPGHENASKHYFSLLYERSVGLAVALAAAGGLHEFASREAEAEALEAEDDLNQDGDHQEDAPDSANMKPEPEAVEEPAP